MKKLRICVLDPFVVVRWEDRENNDEVPSCVACVKGVEELYS